MVVFYGADRLALASRARRQDAAVERPTSAPVFWLNLAVFAAMNTLIGYLLLHNQERGSGALIVFVVMMAVKFVVNDHALHGKHGDRYDAIGRWLLAGAVFVGFGLRYLYRFPDVVPVILQALLAGAVILNVLREELPAERQSRYSPFAIGAAADAALLIVVD